MSDFFGDLQDDDVDLIPGGDNANRRPAQRQAKPAQPVAQEATPNAEAPARSAGASTADLLRRRATRPTPPPAPTPPVAQPRTRPVAPQVEAPAPRPVQPVVTPEPQAPVVAPQPVVEAPRVTAPVAQPEPTPAPTPQVTAPTPQPAYQAPVPAYQPPVYQPPVYEPPVYEAPPVAAPAYQAPAADPAFAAARESLFAAPAAEPQPAAQPAATPVSSINQPAPAPAAEEKKPGMVQWLFGPFMGNPTSKKGKAAQAARAASGTMDNANSISSRRNPRAQSNNYEGARRRVLLIRVVGGATIGLVLLAGLAKIFLPAPEPTKADIVHVARQATNYTGFPQSLGNSVAVGFSKAFLTYDSDNVATRTAGLQRYVGKELLSSFSLGQANEPDAQGNIPAVKQSVIAGPYVINEKDIDEENAVFTTASQLNTGKWVYLSFPILARAARGTAAISGSPSFVPPTHLASVTNSANDVPWTNSDQQAQQSLQPRLVLFLEAWAASTNQAQIDTYLTQTPAASLAAQQGLYNTVSYLAVTNLSVEGVDKTNSNLNDRTAQFSVQWVDKTTGLVYTQTYRLHILFQNSNWYIQDIQNVALLGNGETSTE